VTATRNDDIADVKRKLEELASEGRVQDLIVLVIELLTRVRDDNTALQVRLHKALRALYGRSSEKVSANQLALLFEELDEPAPAGAQSVVDEAVVDKQEEVERPANPPGPPRGKKGRSALPADLPREKRFVPVPDALRTCTICGAAKERIGSIRSELLEFVPAHFKVIDIEREKLVCNNCESGIVAAPDPKPMDKGRPGPGLLAHILVSKCQDSLPLYRQSQIYARSGVALSPATLGEWFTFGCDVCVPIARHVAERVLGSFVIRCDDTGIRVLDRAHPKGVKLGHMWGYVGANDLVVFDYTPTWEAKGPLRFLESFDGFLQGDGYAGFKASLERESGEPIIAEHRRLGCGMHVRRKFEQAADAGDARGAIALAYFRKLYDVERACKQDGLGPDARKQRRDELSQPVLDELYKWAHDVHLRLVPDGKLFAATRYAINQEAAFRRCFDDGRFEIDNGEVERQIRRVAIGRKNYLFAGSDKGAARLAVAYTLLGTCHMHRVDPLAYLTDVIDKVQNGWPQSRIDELAPDVWLRTRQSFAIPAKTEAAATSPPAPD
jgi:transposase